jgi:hypothetical protein
LYVAADGGLAGDREHGMLGADVPIPRLFAAIVKTNSIAEAPKRK